MAEEEGRVVIRCRPYSTFATPPCRPPRRAPERAADALGVRQRPVGRGRPGMIGADPRDDDRGDPHRHRRAPPPPGRAGAGTLVRHGDVALQFDAGRSTVLRLMEAGTPPHALTAVFLTHVHSDHVVGLPDVAMTRWIQQQLVAHRPAGRRRPRGRRRPLRAPHARAVRRRPRAARRARRRRRRSRSTCARSRCRRRPRSSGRATTAQVRVLAVAVHHEPVPDAVAYRVETPDGVVVVSGDTRVCDEVEAAGRRRRRARARGLPHVGAGAADRRDRLRDDLQLPRRHRRARRPWRRAPACPTSCSPTSSRRPTRPATPTRSPTTCATAATSGRVTVGEDLTTIVLEGARRVPVPRVCCPSSLTIRLPILR